MSIGFLYPFTGLERPFANDADAIKNVTESTLAYVGDPEPSKQRAMLLLAAGVEVVLTVRVGVLDGWHCLSGLGQRGIIWKYYDVEVRLALNSQGMQVVITTGKIIERIIRGLEGVDLLFVEWEAAGKEVDDTQEWVGESPHWFAADEVKGGCEKAFEAMSASRRRILKS